MAVVDFSTWGNFGVSVVTKSKSTVPVNAGRTVQNTKPELALRSMGMGST